MPFSSNPLMAPVFQSPVGDRLDHKPPVVSIKRAEDAVESGIRLHHNKAKEGYILQPEVEGLGVAPVELQTAPLASGGSVARHSRLAEGDVFLPITLVSPVPSALPGMFDALVDIVRPGQRDENGLPLQFEVVVFDPYGQETRSRRLIFESGLDDPVRVNHHIWRTSITGRFVDPFWYGQVRELRRRLGQMEKKFITAKQGPPDPDAPPSVTYEWEGEPHASPSVKKVDGQVVARNDVAGYLGWSVMAGEVDLHEEGIYLRQGYTDMTKTVVAPEGVSSVQVHLLARSTEPPASSGWQFFVAIGANGSFSGGRPNFPNDGQWHPVSWSRDVSPGDELDIRLSNNSVSNYSRDVEVSQVQLAFDHVPPADYFNGDTPDVPSRQIGGYEFPFFPVRIGGSVVQGEYELQVEGDAPAYWSGVITPPGEDLLIQNAAGERIFVKGRVDEPILIQTRPQEQDITLADGTPIWDRIDPGDDDFFPLHPGRNTVHVSMVGATQQSEILIRYREAFFHAIGGGS